MAASIYVIMPMLIVVSINVSIQKEQVIKPRKAIEMSVAQAVPMAVPVLMSVAMSVSIAVWMCKPMAVQMIV